MAVDQKGSAGNPSGSEIHPVLPIRDIVVFPHMIVPLFVGREKSIRALEEVMQSDKQILLANQQNPSEDEPTPTAAPTATPAQTGSTSIVCFRGYDSPMRIARIVFTNRTEISGVIRSIGEESTTDQRVEGTLDNGRAELILTDTASNARARQTWTFNPANVEVGNGRSLAVVSCDTIAAELA